MSEFAFSVGQVVRHRVGGDWRGVVVAVQGGDRAQPRPSYEVSYRSQWRTEDGLEFVSQFFEECELITDDEGVAVAADPLPPTIAGRTQPPLPLRGVSPE